MLEQAGLGDNVSRVRVHKEKDLPEARLTLRDEESARRVAKHFKLCRWKDSRVTVVTLQDGAEIVDTPPITLGSQAETTDVFLRGLPPSLCEESLIQAMLEQARLGDNVSGILVHQTKGLPEVCLKVRGKKSAREVAKHFELCQWNNFRVTPVIADGKNKLKPRLALAKSNTTSSSSSSSSSLSSSSSENMLPGLAVAKGTGATHLQASQATQTDDPDRELATVALDTMAWLGL
jgi:hypothetical protein